LNAPFLGFTPQMLAQLAQNAFRPPQGGGAPGMQMPQQGGGLDMGPGMMGLGMGLGMMRRPNGSVPGDAAANAPSSVGGQDIGAYRGPDSYVYGVPPNNAQPSGDGLFGNFGNWWSRNFGSGGT
jgi:hypothetical protein